MIVVAELAQVREILSIGVFQDYMARHIPLQIVIPKNHNLRLIAVRNKKKHEKTI